MCSSRGNPSRWRLVRVAARYPIMFDTGDNGITDVKLFTKILKQFKQLRVL